MRTFILFFVIVSGFVLHAEETTDPNATRVREEEQRKIRAANEAAAQNKDGTRQSERTANQNPSDGTLERKPGLTNNEATGRTPPATTDTAVKRDAEMRERDTKQAEAMAAREAQRPTQTPKAANEQVQRNYQQQRAFDQRENSATTDEQKRKAEESRQGRL